jgi:hypothetical protein
MIKKISSGSNPIEEENILRVAHFNQATQIKVLLLLPCGKYMPNDSDGCNHRACQIAHGNNSITFQVFLLEIIWESLHASKKNLKFRLDLIFLNMALWLLLCAQNKHNTFYTKTDPQRPKKNLVSENSICFHFHT